MDVISSWLQTNLDLVFFIYGLSFVVMGVAIWMLAGEGSKFRIASIFWLLANFGITHGVNEWLDMWVLVKGKTPILDILRWFILIISFCFMFEFGRRLFCLTELKNHNLQKKTSKLLKWHITPFISFLILIISFVSSDFWKTGAILARYLLAFPAGLLISYGFRLYYFSEETMLVKFKVKKYFILAGLSFFFYGAFAGLIVPKSSFFPSNYLNTDSFLLIARIPAQVLRAICAITAACGIFGIIRIFRIETERKLLDAVYQYQTIIGTSLDGFLIVNTEGKFLEANDSYCRLIGYAREELLNMGIGDVEAKETMEETIKHMHSIIENKMERFETQHRAKDGRVLDIEISVTYVDIAGGRFFAFMRDITRKKRMEEAFFYEKEYLDTTLHSIGDAVIVTNTTGLVTLINQVACDLAGWTDKESIGKPLCEVFNIINEHTRLPCENPMDRVLKSGKIVGLGNNTVLISKDGSERIIADSAAPIYDRSRSAITGVILIFRDITEKKRSEKILEKRIEELERFSKVTVDRELVMAELKEKIKKLEARIAELEG